MKRREDTLSPESTHSHVSQDTPWPSTPGHAATAPHVGTSTSPHAGPVLQGRMSPWPLGSIPPGPTLAPGSIKMMEVQVTHPGNTGHAGLRRQQLPQASCPFLSGLGVKLGFPDPRHPHPTHLKPSWTQHGHPCPTVASCSSCLPWRLHSECRWSLSPAGGVHHLIPVVKMFTHTWIQAGLGDTFRCLPGHLQWDRSARLPPACPLGQGLGGHVRPSPVQKRHGPWSERSALGVSWPLLSQCSAEANLPLQTPRRGWGRRQWAPGSFEARLLHLPTPPLAPSRVRGGYCPSLQRGEAWGKPCSPPHSQASAATSSAWVGLSPCPRPGECPREDHGSPPGEHCCCPV